MTIIIEPYVEIIDTVIAFCGIIVVLYAMSYFREGILIKTLRRALLVVILMFVHFFLELLGELRILVVPDFVGDLLELAFTLGLAWTLYALVKDWKTIGNS